VLRLDMHACLKGERSKVCVRIQLIHSMRVVQWEWSPHSPLHWAIDQIIPQSLEAHQSGSAKAKEAFCQGHASVDGGLQAALGIISQAAVLPCGCVYSWLCHGLKYLISCIRAGGMAQDTRLCQSFPTMKSAERAGAAAGGGASGCKKVLLV
jgi:hypothetical protein